MGRVNTYVTIWVNIKSSRNLIKNVVSFDSKWVFWMDITVFYAESTKRWWGYNYMGRKTLKSWVSVQHVFRCPYNMVVLSMFFCHSHLNWEVSLEQSAIIFISSIFEDNIDTFLINVSIQFTDFWGESFLSQIFHFSVSVQHALILCTNSMTIRWLLWSPIVKGCI